MSTFDAAVIGSGPAGVTAALYLVRSGCSVILFEKMAAGGQILQTEALENYPGYPKGIKGYELADLFAAHLEGLPVTHSRDAVESVSGEAGNFVVQAGGKEHSCRTVIVCSGAHHRELGLADEKRLQGRGVSYCALCDGNFFRNAPVAVVGGGNAALEESLYLAKLASKVYLIHRRDEFRGAKIYQDKLEAMPDKVELVRSSVVTVHFRFFQHLAVKCDMKLQFIFFQPFGYIFGHGERQLFSIFIFHVTHYFLSVPYNHTH